MMEPTRRTFVSGMLAGLPALAMAGQQPAPAAGADPVWTQIMSDLQRIYGELTADPSRRDSLRALESTITMHAAYSTALGNPARVQRAVAARLRGAKREFLDEVRRMSSREHRDAELRRYPPKPDGRRYDRPDPSDDELERAANAVAQHGHIPVLMAAANMARALAEQKPQFARVRLETAQWDLCRQFEAEIAGISFMTGIVCALTVAMPALVPECAALAATLAVMEMTYFIFCTWL
jgi:hypothetical protein